MTARIAHVAGMLLLVTHAAIAQPPAPSPKPVKPRPVPVAPEVVTPAPAETRRMVEVAPAPPARNQPINVRVDITISEQRGKAAPNRKLLSIIAADGFRNAIRSQESFSPPPIEVPLNVDVLANILTEMQKSTGKIRLGLN